MKLRDGWAIIGRHGLYVGWHQTRRQMIAEHVSDIHGVASYVTTRGLDASQIKAWRECTKNGDRAIKVSIHYQAPTAPQCRAPDRTSLDSLRKELK